MDAREIIMDVETSVEYDKAFDGETILEDDESRTDASEVDYSHLPALPTVDASKKSEDELSEAENDLEFDD